MANKPPYSAVIHRELRHEEAPDSDDAFRHQLGRRVRQAMLDVDATCADILSEEAPGHLISSDQLHLAFETMQKKGLRVLSILDFFDRLRIGAEISDNLLGQLRAYGQLGSLRLLTASRRPLWELCKSKETLTSDFHRTFRQPPSLVGPFGESDLTEFLAPFASRRITFGAGALTEFANWSGGIAVLAVAMAQRLYDRCNDGTTISKEQVDAVAGSVSAEDDVLLAELWEDCSQEMRSELAALFDGPLEQNKIPSERLTALVRRGFVVSAKSKCAWSCRLMETYGRRNAGVVQEMGRLFGTRELFNYNARRMLELRLSHASIGRKDIVKQIASAIEDVVADPRRSLESSRVIVESAFDVIWEAEHPKGGPLPKEWVDAWKLRVMKLPEGIDPLPDDRGDQCRLLRYVTGRDNALQRVAKRISRQTSALID